MFDFTQNVEGTYSYRYVQTGPAECRVDLGRPACNMLCEGIAQIVELDTCNPVLFLLKESHCLSFNAIKAIQSHLPRLRLFVNGGECREEAM